MATIAPRASKVLKTTEPKKREAGENVADVDARSPNSKPLVGAI